MKIIKLIALTLSFSIFLFAFCSCKPSKEEPKTQAESYYDFFDTVSYIFSYKGDTREEFNANCLAVKDVLSRYHRLFDIYYEYSGVNNIKTVNNNAGKAPVEVDSELIDFLLYTKELYTLTNGKTNIAIGAVTRLWHDAREKGIRDPENAYIPSASDLENAALHCDISNLVIDKTAGTVFISDPDMSLDVGAIGKGYATEKAAELLIERGVSSYVLNIGGNIRAIGEKTTGDGWTTGITNPDKSSSESFVTRVVIKDISLVTSGDYERFYTVDGVRYHHIINPDTNMPANYFSSVSVFAKDSGLADALSTALFCLSYEDGLALVNKIGDVDVIWVYADGALKSTENIEFYAEN